MEALELASPMQSRHWGVLPRVGKGNQTSQLKNRAQNSTLGVEEAQRSCPCVKVRRRASDGDLRCHVSIPAVMLRRGGARADQPFRLFP
jgi:hypothetical protein